MFFCDHHPAGDVPAHQALQTLIETVPGVCTSSLIDRYLEGAKAGWAVCGAYGDNFYDLAAQIASERKLALPLSRLRELGELVDYNAYGATLDDLHFHPADLYAQLLKYPDPMAFIEDAPAALDILRQGHRSDWEIAGQARDVHISAAGQILSLPASPASNRISGLFANALVDEDPDKGFAVLTRLGAEGGGYRVSLRAPTARKSMRANTLAAKFGGGGRAEAAGIDVLSEDNLNRFVDAFTAGFAVID